MDEMWNWAKDNYQFISLLVGLIGVIIAIISLVVEIKKRKKDVASKIAEKQARLDAINGIHLFPDMTSGGNAMIERATLEKEVEALKKKL